MTLAARQFSLRSEVLLAGTLAALMLLALAAIALRSTSEFVNVSRAAVHSEGAVEVLETLMRYERSAESAQRGFLLTGNERFLENYSHALSKAKESFAALQKNISNEKDGAARVDALRVAFDQKAKLMEEGISIRRASGLDAVRVWLDQSADFEAMNALRDLANLQLETEATLLIKSKEATERVGAFSKGMIVVVTLFALALFLGGTRTILRDLRRRTDIERALAQERNLLDALINTLPEYVYVKDLERRFIMNNKAHLELLGLKTQAEALGKRSEDFFPTERIQSYVEGDLKILQNGISSFAVLDCFKDKSGHPWWISTTKVALRDADGKITGLVGISTDVTQYKVAEEQLRLTAARIERQNRELQDFATVASHDLQEPLRKIVAFTDRVLRKHDQTLGEDGQDYLQRSLDAARRMQTLIQDLLKLSQVGSREGHFAPVDLSELLWDVLSDLEIQVETSRAILKVGALPVIDGDPVLLRQLFQNLLANAMKFQQPGVPPIISVQASIEPATAEPMPGQLETDSVCKITVTDNGIGFDQKFSDQIFTIFQRLHSREKYEGTGIGLAVVRRIVERHGGKIEAHSVENEGATFSVTLPVKQTKNQLP
jgi:PAS domain S-box-containing protein